MLRLLQDLVAHKGHSNAAFLSAVRRSATAAADVELLELLHHILIANRFWICSIRRAPFLVEREAGTSRAIAPLAEAFRATQNEEQTWLATATEEDCAAVLTEPLIPGGSCQVGEALVQVCMHSHAHRAQIARLLRGHGVVPPQTDFILWLRERRLPEWDVAERLGGAEGG